MSKKWTNLYTSSPDAAYPISDAHVPTIRAPIAAGKPGVSQAVPAEECEAFTVHRKYLRRIANRHVRACCLTAFHTLRGSRLALPQSVFTCIQARPAAFSCCLALMSRRFSHYSSIDRIIADGVEYSGGVLSLKRYLKLRARPPDGLRHVIGAVCIHELPL